MEKNRRGFLGVLMAAAFTGIATRAWPAKTAFMDSMPDDELTPAAKYDDVPTVQMGLDLSEGADQTIEGWYDNDGWHHFAQVRKDGVTTMYLDGQKVSYLPESFVGWGKDNKPALFVETVHGNFRELEFKEIPERSMMKVMTPTGNLVLRDGALRASP